MDGREWTGIISHGQGPRGENRRIVKYSMNSKRLVKIPESVTENDISREKIMAVKEIGAVWEKKAWRLMA